MKLRTKGTGAVAGTHVKGREKRMISNCRIKVSLALGALALSGFAWADDAPPAGAERRAGSDVTMRIIEDPDALDATVITRRIELPLPQAATDGRGRPADRPGGGPVEGMTPADDARQQGREFGAEVADRARQLAEQASEQRDEFGRSRAEEMRPEPPEKPEPPQPPVPPRP
jgi:hypothetical protein